MTCEVDILIIGAGIVGLAVAAGVSREGRQVYILEKNESFGRETSSRNSGTIHTSILSPRGSLNAALCFAGAEMIYRICREYGVPCRKTGKLLVAGDEAESGALDLLYSRRDEGIEMQRLSRREIHFLEPEVKGVDGLLLPAAGVVDAYELMRCFLGQATLRGAQLVCGAEATAIEKLAQGYRVEFRDCNGLTSIEARIVVNCAGLQSDKVAAMPGIDVERAGYRLTYFKGEYYAIDSAKARKFDRRLVYPMLRTGGLVGIHTVLDVDGRVRLGPDFYPVEQIDYSMNDSRKAVFLEGVSRLFSGIGPEDIEPESCGVMPRAYGTGESFRSFVVRHEQDRGLPGFINLVGIESPGLTSSPAIGRRVDEMAAELLGDGC